MTKTDRRSEHGKQLAVTINTGIYVAATDGWLAAVQLVQREQVAMKVICRVLCEPELRRPTTQR